jgi:hypothetical protein
MSGNKFRKHPKFQFQKNFSGTSVRRKSVDDIASGKSIGH